MAFIGTHTTGTLAQQMQPRQGVLANKTVFNTMLVVVGSLLIALMAQIRIPLPFTPVPIVLSTLGVLLAGSLLGTRLGLMTILLYLALGAIGLPFFAGGNGGIQYMQGATLGYLVAYPVVAVLMGWFAERGWDRQVPTTIAMLVIGSALFYMFGVAWLAFGLGMGLGAAIVSGMLPFLIGDAVKIAIAVGVLPGGWALLGSSKTRD